MCNKNILDLINILSFLIGIENLNKNDEQINQLEQHLIKQDKQYEEIIKLLKEGGINMYRDNYGNYNGYGNDYGRRYNEGNYGRRGVDAKYRGAEVIDEMADNFGRYMESKEYGNYGGADVNKALDYMLHSIEDFMMMLKNDASSQEEIEKIRKTAKRISDM